MSHVAAPLELLFAREEAARAEATRNSDCAMRRHDTQCRRISMRQLDNIDPLRQAEKAYRDRPARVER